MATVTVVAHGDNGSSSSTPITVPLTGMATSEALVIVMAINQNSTVDTVIMGTAASWHTRRLSLGYGSIRYSHTTGHSGDGNVTFTSSIDHGYSYVIYRIAGLTNPGNVTITDSWWDRVEGVSTTFQFGSLEGTSEYPPAQRVGTGQVAVFFGSSQLDMNQGDVIYPATGWVTDHVKVSAINLFAAHLEVTAPGYAHNSVKGTGGGGTSLGPMGATLLVFGDGSLPSVASLPVHVAECSPVMVSAVTNLPIPIKTVLVPNDVVVVLGVKSDVASALNVTGFSATWTQAFSLDNTVRGAQAHYATGITGAGSVSVQNTHASLQARVLVLVLRGLASPTLAGVQYSDWSAATTLPGVPEYAPAQPFNAGHVAIALGMVSAENVTALVPASPTPATGWVTDQAVLGASLPTVYEVHRIGTSTGTVQVGIQGASVPQNLNMVTMVFGPAGPPPGDMGGTWS